MKKPWRVWGPGLHFRAPEKRLGTGACKRNRPRDWVFRDLKQSPCQCAIGATEPEAQALRLWFGISETMILVCDALCHAVPCGSFANPFVMSVHSSEADQHPNSVMVTCPSWSFRMGTNPHPEWAPIHIGRSGSCRPRGRRLSPRGWPRQKCSRTRLCLRSMRENN